MGSAGHTGDRPCFINLRVNGFVFIDEAVSGGGFWQSGCDGGAWAACLGGVSDCGASGALTNPKDPM